MQISFSNSILCDFIRGMIFWMLVASLEARALHSSIVSGTFCIASLMATFNSPLVESSMVRVDNILAICAKYYLSVMDFLL